MRTTPSSAELRLPFLLTLLVAVLLPTASPAQNAPAWPASNPQVIINGPLHLNLDYVDRSHQPTSAIVSSLPPSALSGMPSGLETASKSPLLNWTESGGGYFDAIWSSISGQVCSDIQQRILKQVNQSPNTAYDIQPCHMISRGGLLVTFQSNWAGSDILQPGGTGRRIVFDYTAPLNGVLFWVTSPHTCHHGHTCPTEPQDPAIFAIFTVHLTVTCTSQSPTNDLTLLPVTCTPSSNVTTDAVIGGDVTGQLDAAAIKWVKQLAVEGASVAASGGSSLPAAAAAAIAGAVNVAVKGIGAGIAAISDQHLRDFVSQALTILASPTAQANAVHANTDLTNFFQDLLAAQSAGMRPFTVAAAVTGTGSGKKISLNFNLFYPPPAAPTLQNTTQSQNKGSIISPMIAVTQPQVQAGQTIPVQATLFRGTYVNELDMAWNKTVVGKPTSKLAWGPPPQEITIPALTFQATDLKPLTKYTFIVQECDELTCSLPSEKFQTVTEGAAASDVTFWLDNNRTQPVGSEHLANGGGSFTANITIPPATAPGQHTLNAAAPGQPTATAPLFVCARGGCGPSVALVNTSNNTFYPPGWRVEISYPVTVRGSQFTPGGSAIVYLDNPAGQKLGAAPVGPLGHFQLTFNMPRVAQGTHILIAIEGGAANFVPGHPLQNILAKEHAGKTTEASVNVVVQAMAQ